VSGSGISWAICKSAPRSRQITMPDPNHSVFYRPDALPVAQPIVSKQWRQNQSFVTKPTIQQPGFDLPRHMWCALNRFCTGLKPCITNLQKWGFASANKCECGMVQTMSHKWMTALWLCFLTVVCKDFILPMMMQLTGSTEQWWKCAQIKWTTVL